MSNLPRYEALVLVPTSSTNEDISAIERNIDDICTKAEGSVISFDKWGKFQLCFPVKKHSYGLYFLARFEMAHEKVGHVLKDIETLFKIKHNDLVLRHVVAKLEPGASLEYQKPESLDVSREGNIEKKDEAKIERLLDTVESSKPADKVAAPAQEEAPAAEQAAEATE